MKWRRKKDKLTDAQKRAIANIKKGNAVIYGTTLILGKSLIYDIVFADCKIYKSDSYITKIESNKVVAQYAEPDIGRIKK